MLWVQFTQSLLYAVLIPVCIFLSERLCKVLEYINEVHSLCGVLGINFGSTVHEVHPSLHQNGIEQSRNISNSTLEGLATTIYKLKAERKSRIHKVFPRFLSLRFKLLSIDHNTVPNDPLLTDERDNGIIMSALETYGLS